MTLGRALRDVRKLESTLEEEFSGRLHYDFSDEREVRIDGFHFPEGWQNRSGGRHGTVLIEVTEDYPDHPPRVYIADDMRFRGSRPAEMAPGRIDSPAEWAAVSLFPSPDDWDPTADSLLTVFQRLREVLENPQQRDHADTDAGHSNHDQ